MTVKPGTFVSLGDIGQAMGRFEAEVLVKFHDPELSIVSQKRPRKAYSQAGTGALARECTASGVSVGKTLMVPLTEPPRHL